MKFLAGFEPLLEQIGSQEVMQITTKNSPDNSPEWKEQFERKISNKDGCVKAKGLRMKPIYSVIYSVNGSARNKIVRDIKKKIEIKKAANQRLAAIVGKTGRSKTRYPFIFH